MGGETGRAARELWGGCRAERERWDVDTEVVLIELDVLEVRVSARRGQLRGDRLNKSIYVGFTVVVEPAKYFTISRIPAFVGGIRLVGLAGGR